MQTWNLNQQNNYQNNNNNHHKLGSSSNSEERGENQLQPSVPQQKVNHHNNNQGKSKDPGRKFTEKAMKSTLGLTTQKTFIDRVSTNKTQDSDSTEVMDSKHQKCTNFNFFSFNFFLNLLIFT